MTILKLNKTMYENGAIDAIIGFYESCDFSSEIEQNGDILSLVFENGDSAVFIDIELVNGENCSEINEMLEIAEFEI